VPDFIPYTAGVDAASAAGSAMGKASAPSPIGGFLQGFQPGFDQFIGDVREDRKKKKRMEESRKFLDELEAKNPDLANDKSWWWVQGHIDAGGEPTEAIKQFMSFKQHEKDQAAQNEIKTMLANSQVERRGVQNENDIARTQLGYNKLAADNMHRSTMADQGLIKIDQGERRLGETQRHNQATESVAQQRADQPRGGRLPEQDAVDEAESQRKAATRYRDRARKAYEDTQKYAPPTDKDGQLRHQQEVAARRHELEQAEQDEFEAQKAVAEARRNLTAARRATQGPRTVEPQPMEASGGDDFQSYYDSLPSGAEYVGPDGKKRRKR
jgi:hypothetical protein